MPRYKLRTLLILLAVGPPLLAILCGAVWAITKLVARAATSGAEGF
jgi:hypothetical protein